mmetsp:Transcript_44433/g.105296  ORF Transcript_44433/g.105296 Transcript_44433/m.105296 type:complete len:515 (+) Transcript_44433:226-1770(+)
MRLPNIDESDEASSRQNIYADLQGESGISEDGLTAPTTSLTGEHLSDGIEAAVGAAESPAAHAAAGANIPPRFSAQAAANAGQLVSPTSAEAQKSFLSRAAKKTGKFMPGRSRLGALVTEESTSWSFSRGLVSGIASTVHRASKDYEAAGSNIQPEDFSQYYKESIPGQEAARRFKDYAPKVFHALRHRFGVDDQMYLASIHAHGLSEISTSQTGSKSGQKFFVTADGRYFMKTITKSESKFFRKVLQQYYEHVKSSKNTLLCRFFGLHRIQPGNLHLLVMSNIFDTDRIIHQRYDLKGSTVGRKVSEAEKQQETVILKDLDFKENLGKITLGADRKALLMSQMKADSQFLRSIGVMDYSLLVGVHLRDKDSEAQMQRPSGRPDSFPPPSASAGQGIGHVDPTEVQQLTKAQRRDHLIRTGSLIQRKVEKSHTSAFQEDDGGWCSLAVVGESGQQVSGREIYFVGIIDYLQFYNRRKKAETFFKGMQYKRSEISAVKPELYAERFIAFIDSILN